MDVVGGGLAGSEAAWQLAERGHRVVLHEMRPLRGTAAHQTDRLAELVCSNTFKSTEVTNAHGLLKAEMRVLGSLILAAADEARVAAGSALAVDRDSFSETVQGRLLEHPRITVERGEWSSLPSPGIVATGPLTSDALAATLRERLGVDSLAFYDAIAPIVSLESLDESVVFRASRYGKETMAGAGDEGAYLNCPMTREEYEAFIDALAAADQFTAHEFDKVPYFEGCMPAEEMARRGRESLRFGPMKPVGIEDPRTGRRPYAVVQLRREDRQGRMWNLVGFQTRLRIPEPGTRVGGIPAVRQHPSQFVRERARLSLTASLAAGRPDGPARWSAHRRGRVHGIDRDGAAGGREPGSHAARAPAGGATADHDDRGVVPAPARGRSRHLPAHERELRADRGVGERAT